MALEDAGHHQHNAAEIDPTDPACGLCSLFHGLPPVVRFRESDQRSRFAARCELGADRSASVEDEALDREQLGLRTIEQAYAELDRRFVGQPRRSAS
jgi:hypothetical protein